MDYRQQISLSALNDNWEQAEAIIKNLVEITGNTHYDWQFQDAIKNRNWSRFQELCSQLICQSDVPDSEYVQSQLEAGRAAALYKNNPSAFGDMPGKKIG